jgi:hypothetical protein
MGLESHDQLAEVLRHALIAMSQILRMPSKPAVVWGAMLMTALALGGAMGLAAWWLTVPPAASLRKPSEPGRVTARAWRLASEVPNGSAAGAATSLAGRGGAVTAPAIPGDRYPPDTRERNARIPIAQLTTSRPLAAEAFLQEVLLEAQARGGFKVRAVEPGGIYDQMGLRSGDVIYSLDTPAMSEVDEASMISLMHQAQIEVNIYRNGTPMALRHALNVDEDPSLAELR